MKTLITRAIALLEKIPHSLIAFIARFSIAAVFWKSGQTKVEGLAIDLIDINFRHSRVFIIAKSIRKLPFQLLYDLCSRV